MSVAVESFIVVTDIKNAATVVAVLVPSYCGKCRSK